MYRFSNKSLYFNRIGVFFSFFNAVHVENDGKDEEDMSLDSGDEASQIEICNDASEYDTRLETLQTETKSSRGVDAKESCVSELSPEARRSLMDKSSKIDMEEIKPITPLSTTHSAEGEKHNSVQRAPFNTRQNQEGGSYFPSPYSQRRDKEKSSLPGGWDKNCDSSRPYSKRK